MKIWQKSRKIWKYAFVGGSGAEPLPPEASEFILKKLARKINGNLQIFENFDRKFAVFSKFFENFINFFAIISAKIKKYAPLGVLANLLKSN